MRVVVARSGGFEQAPQLVVRVDMRDKGPRRFRHDLGQRGDGHISTCEGETIKAKEHLVLTMPERWHRSGAGYISIHPIALDLCNCDIAHRSTKRLQGAFFCAEAHAHRLFVCDILGGKLRQFLRRPPSSKFATSCNPAKSTLA